MPDHFRSNRTPNGLEIRRITNGGYDIGPSLSLTKEDAHDIFLFQAPGESSIISDFEKFTVKGAGLYRVLRG